MHDDDFFADLAMFRDGSVPEAGPELRALFASVAAAAPAVEPARRLPVYKRIFAGVPSKVAAGALGALLAGSVGAGALTGTMVLTSNDDDAAVCPAVSDDHGDVVVVPVVAGDDSAEDTDAGVGADEPADSDDAVCDEDDAATDDDDESTEDGATDDEADESEVVEPTADVPTDLASVPVPTSVSEAAHNHAFDEACGNHGAYVSHFAKTGEEPECATAARGAATAETETETDGAEATADEPGAEGRANAEAHREVTAERKAAKAVTAGKPAHDNKSTKSGKGGR